MSLYVISYDISDNKRRQRARKILRRYGQNVQESVFEAWLEPAALEELRGRLGAELSKTDLLDIYPVDERPNRARYRWQRNIEKPAVIVFVGGAGPSEV